MEKTVKISALRIAEQLNLKDIKGILASKQAVDGSFELFYSGGPEKYAQYLNYGVVVFTNFAESEVLAAIDKIKSASIHPVTWLRHDQTVKVTDAHPEEVGIKVEADHILVGKFDAVMARMIMFNLAQSLALDHYRQLSDTLLGEVRGFTTNLETTGKLKINRRNMMKFIGRALNSQNNIADNAYIFAGPERTWDDPGLDASHQSLQKHLGIRTRVSEIEYTLRIIEDNLKVFLQISNQRESNLLEWIIIVLILVEIINLFLTQWIK